MSNIRVMRRGTIAMRKMGGGKGEENFNKRFINESGINHGIVVGDCILQQ